MPLCLPWIFLESLLQQQIDEAVGPQQMGAWSLVAGLLFYPLYTAALILFMDARGRDERPRVGQLWSAALRLWPAFALLAALTSLLIVLGLSLLILPGIFVMVKLSFAEFCLVLRGRSPLQALRESFEFTRGRFFLILACSLVILLPVWSLEAWLADLGRRRRRAAGRPAYAQRVLPAAVDHRRLPHLQPRSGATQRDVNGAARRFAALAYA